LTVTYVLKSDRLDKKRKNRHPWRIWNRIVYSLNGRKLKRKPVFRKVDCVSFPVENIDYALSFYQKLGHKCLWRDGDNAAGIELPDSDSEIVVHNNNLPTETYFLVDSVKDAIQEILSAGGNLDFGPIEIQAGLYARLKDPFDNILVIMDLTKGTLKTDESGFVIGNNEV